MDIAQDLIPATLLLLEAYSVYVRSCILGQMKQEEEGETIVTKQQLEAFGTVMSIGSSHASKISVLGNEIMATLPRPITMALEKWSNDSKNEFPGASAWVSNWVCLYLELYV